MKKIFLLLILIQASASPTPESAAKQPQPKLHEETPPPMSSKLAKLQEAEATRQLAEKSRNEAEARLDAARAEKARAKQNYEEAKQKIKPLEKNDSNYAEVENELKKTKAERDQAAKEKEKAMKDFVDESAWLKKSEAEILSIKTDEHKVFKVGRELGEKTKGYANIATIVGVPVSLAAAGVGAAALAYKFAGDDTPTQEAIAQSASDINVEEVDAPAEPSAAP
jgi:hypothetical protein